MVVIILKIRKNDRGGSRRSIRGPHVYRSLGKSLWTPGHGVGG